MADACCGPSQTEDVADIHEAAAPERLRDVTTLRLAAGAAVLLGAGWLATRLGADIVGLVATAGALVVGGATFVPESLRGLRHGSLGVGTLMTIAAVGATLLATSSRRPDWPCCSRSLRGWRPGRWPAPAAGCAPCSTSRHRARSCCVTATASRSRPMRSRWASCC